MRATSWRLNISYTLAVVVLSPLCCLSQSQQHSPGFAHKTVVDSGEIDIGQNKKTRTLLTVDRDGRVELYTSRISEGTPASEPEFERYLGNRIYYSGQTPLGAVLPTNVVPTAAFQATFDSGKRFDVVLGLMLQKSRELTRTTYNIYIFKEEPKPASLHLVAKQEELDQEPRFFTVLPSADGTAYRVIDIGGGDGPDIATVRDLAPDGSLKEIQSFSAYEIKFFPPSSDRRGSFLLIEKANRNDSADFCYKHRSLEWSQAKQQYVPSD